MNIKFMLIDHYDIPVKGQQYSTRTNIIAFNMVYSSTISCSCNKYGYYLLRGVFNITVISQRASHAGAFKQCRRRRRVRDWPLYHKSVLTRRSNWLGDRGPPLRPTRLPLHLMDPWYCTVSTLMAMLLCSCSTPA